MALLKLGAEASFALVMLASSGCSGGSPLAAPVTREASLPRDSIARHIRHIVIVVQENRSFDNLFSGLPGADAPRFGYAGTKKIQLHPTPLEDPGNIENNWRDAISSWNHGKMNGWEHEHFYGGP